MFHSCANNHDLKHLCSRILGNDVSTTEFRRNSLQYVMILVQATYPKISQKYLFFNNDFDLNVAQEVAPDELMHAILSAEICHTNIEERSCNIIYLRYFRAFSVAIENVRKALNVCTSGLREMLLLMSRSMLPALNYVRF